MTKRPGAGSRRRRKRDKLSLVFVRRPNNDRLFSLGSVFEDKGYAVLFAYGGYGYFDNLNAFFEANDYRNAMVLLHPKRKTEAFRIDANKNILQAMNDPALVREAISFYAAAAYVFRTALYRDEEQVPPEDRLALKSRNGG